jgi:hypothetical protein
MTKEEWLKRCANRFVEKAWVVRKSAEEMAQACWENVKDHLLGACPLTEEQVLANAVSGNYTPEEAADEEMSAWDGE